MVFVAVDDARDPPNENGDIDYLMSLGPVQQTGVFNTTEILVIAGPSPALNQLGARGSKI